MVPVPEEHVSEVLRHVVRLLGEDEDSELGTGWDVESIAELYASSSEEARSLLSFLAHPDNAGRELPAREVARALELRGANLSGIIGPLSKRARRTFGRRSPIESAKAGTEAGESGRARRSLSITEDVARMVRAAERKVDGDLEPPSVDHVAESTG